MLWCGYGFRDGLRSVISRGEVCVDGLLPVVSGGSVVRGERGYVLVAFRGEGGASVEDVNLGGSWVGWSKADVDGGDQNVGHEVGVYEVAAFEIEQGVDPGSGERAVLYGEYRALFVVRDLGMKEMRIPVLAGPRALAFGAKERRGLEVGQVDREVKGRLRAKELRRRLAECGGAEGRGGCDSNGE